MHASLTLNDESLRACADAIASDGGFHIHVAEHEADEDDSLRRSGTRVVERLDNYGIWRDTTIAAHFVHIDDNERDILLDRGVWVSHQPRSNMNNGVGAADIDSLLESGIKLCLGNDRIQQQYVGGMEGRLSPAQGRKSRIRAEQTA